MSVISGGLGSTRTRTLILDVFVVAFLVAAQINETAIPAIAAVAVMVVVWGVRVWRRPLTLLVGLLVANYAYWLLNAVAFARVPLSQFAHFDFLRWDARVFVYYVPFLFFSTFRLSRQRLWLFAQIAGVFAAVVVIVALLTRWGGVSLPGLPKLIRDENDANTVYPFFFGLFKTHNAAGDFYGVLCVVYAVLVGAWREMPRRPLYAVTWVVLVVGLVLTLSREAAISFAAALVIWVLLDWRRNLAPGAALLLAAVVIGVVVNHFDNGSFQGRLNSLGPQNHNTAARLAQQGPSISYFESSPIFGIGFSRWNDVWNEDLHYYRGTGIPHLVWFATHYVPVDDDQQPHNSYLLIAAELGVVGLLLMGAFWGTFLLEMLRGLKRLFPPGSFEHTYVAAGAAVAIFVVVDALFGNALELPSLGLTASFFGGTAFALTGSGGAREYVGLFRERFLRASAPARASMARPEAADR